MCELDDRVRCLLSAGDIGGATAFALRELGPEVLGFLSGVLIDADADEVYSSLIERLWKSFRDFQGRCSVRTWTYGLARRELWQFRRQKRRRAEGRVPISELKDILAAARTRTRTTVATDKREKFRALRDELPIEDRTLLILRLDRGLTWSEIALAFTDAPETLGDEEREREAARLRKRYQLIKQRLRARLRKLLV